MEWLLQEWTQYWLAVQNFLAVDLSRLYQPDMIGRMILQVMLLCGSAFFSGSETALFSLSRLDLQRLRKERDRHSETLHELLDQPRRLIISILCGNELINIAAAANMTGILVTLYGADRAGLINVLVMVPLILLFGEVTPKTIAVSNPVRFSTAVVAGPMSGWVRLITPLRWAIRSVSDRVTTWIVGEETAKENILQVDEFRSLVEEVAKEGELSATERALIYNLLEAGDTEIVEIMTPRTRVCFINGRQSVAEMLAEFRRYRHSRVPVFRGHRDRLVGFIHAEDIVQLVFKGEDLDSVKKSDILRPPVVVPLTKTVDEMFDFFQKNQARAAIVLNEFGGVEGFITMDDVLSFIFGEISEDMEGQELYQERDENFYEVPGEMKLTDFNNLSNFGIEDPRMTTVGGVAFRHLDRLPKVGDKVTVDGFVMTVLAMQEHRIARVRVVRGAALDEDLEEAAQLEKNQRGKAGAGPIAANEERPDEGALESTTPGDESDRAEQPDGEVSADFGRSLPVVWEGQSSLPDETPAAQRPAIGESEVTETIEERNADGSIATAPEDEPAEPASTQHLGEDDDPLPDPAMGEAATVQEEGGPVAASPAEPEAQPTDPPVHTQEAVGEEPVDSLDGDSVSKEGLSRG